MFTMCLWFDCNCPILILCCNFVMIYVISSIHALLRVCSLQACMLKYNQNSYPVIHLPIHSSICLFVSLSIHPSIHSLMYVISRPFVMFSVILLLFSTGANKYRSAMTTCVMFKRELPQHHIQSSEKNNMLVNPFLIYEYAIDFPDTMHVHHNNGTIKADDVRRGPEKITESTSTLSNTYTPAIVCLTYLQ